MIVIGTWAQFMKSDPDSRCILSLQTSPEKSNKYFEKKNDGHSLLGLQENGIDGTHGSRSENGTDGIHGSRDHINIMSLL